MMKVNKKYIILFLTITLIFGACKTIKKTADISNDLAVSKVLISKVQKADPLIKSLNIQKMSLLIELDGKKINSQAYCKIITDSVIQISLQPFFGVEMFVARLDPVNIIVLDKTKNICYQADYATLEKYTGTKTDFSVLQNLLLNRYFLLSDGLIDENNTGLASEKGVINGITLNNNNISQKILLNDTFRITLQEILWKKYEEKLTVIYSENAEINGISFPAKIKFIIAGNNNKSGFEMQLNKAEINMPVSLPELNLQNYRKAGIESLLKL
jgi:hypothetical protein